MRCRERISIWIQINFELDDFQFQLAFRIIDVQMNAAPLQGIVDFTGPVGGDDNDGRLSSFDCAILHRI